MGICARNHAKIFFEGRECPLCRMLEENKKLRHQNEAMQFDLFISMEEAILDLAVIESKPVFASRA